jgi:peptidoglycan/xylan/chitin deacetylase (PgdA/CDA1 family)/glycosyltransferase involved in cell wall biosynthesis/2-polyprenyl-3-methyl-5-hydroxy-6-metoxy-1,4-benzoquinol methylase
MRTNRRDRMKSATPAVQLFSPTDRKATHAPGVAVVIPAHNAEATLEATLNSMLRQTHSGWEAVIVDDGSTDSTYGMAESWEKRDGRFRALQQEKSGVSAARNRGLREARYPYVLFLDSDDRIASTHLERMLGVLLADTQLDAVHCGWQRMFPSGYLGPPHLGSAQGDLFEILAFQCIFAIHACVVRRDLALAVGGFDPSLSTCEDWDFFQRIARTGARFGSVPEVLAFYYTRENSASQNSRRYLSDARVVVGRGHGRDPRMRIAAPVHAEGRDPALRDLALYYILIYLASQEIGAARDGLDLLEAGDSPPPSGLLPATVAQVIYEPVPTAANRPVEDWPALWSQVNAPLAAFLARLEDRTRVPKLAFATLRELEKIILLADSDNTSLLLGSTYRVNVDLSKRISDVFLPREADRLICKLNLEGKPVGALELPGTEMLTGRRLAEAVLKEQTRLPLRVLLAQLCTSRILYVCLATARDLLRRRTLRRLMAILATLPKARLGAVSRLKQEVASVLKANLPKVLATRPGLAAKRAEQRWRKYLDTAAAVGRAQAREQINTQSPNEWDRLFALPDPWAYESDYEVVKYAQTLALLPEGIVGDALEIACAEGHFTNLLAPRARRLTVVDISERALARARTRCAHHSNILFQILDLNESNIPGPFDLIVCSEVLYYVLDLPGVVSRILAQVRPGGFFLTANARALADDPEGSGFDWNQAFGAETIAHAIASQPGIFLRQELRAPLYRVLLYQRVPDGAQVGPSQLVKTDHMGRLTRVSETSAKWPGRPPIRTVTERAFSVPILTYHRIATNGPAALERFRVTPHLFAAQMETLFRAGYRTIALEAWINAMARHEPLPGKPIILTFDDGYRDFLTAAMPVLRARDFLATVFLVAERIGETSDWDAGYGEPAPLLSWEEVLALREAGIEFGCHSSVHRPMTGMPLPEMAADAVRARAILEEGLATSVKTFAYPYGGQSGLVRRVIADLGFQGAVSCEPGISRLGDDRLRLPRIEVLGECTPDRLIASIDGFFVEH